MGFTYARVDQLLYLLVDKRYTAEACVEYGFDEAFVRNVIQRIRRYQFKRVMPPIAKVNETTIGREFKTLADIGL